MMHVMTHYISNINLSFLVLNQSSAKAAVLTAYDTHFLKAVSQWILL